MNNTVSNRALLVAPVLFVVSLLVTVLFFALTPDRFDRRIMWFPDTVGGDIHAEWRRVPARSGLREQIAMYIEEVILGPSSLGAIPYIPENTRVRSTIVEGESRTVFVDFDREVMFGSIRDEISFDDVESLLTRSLLHNFRQIDSVVLTIEGQVPNSGRFGVDGR